MSKHIDGSAETSGPLAAAIQAILGARPTPDDHRSLADRLRELADEQRRLAEAKERIGATHYAARREQANVARRGGRPKGSGGRFVRYSPGEGYTGQLHIAPALYQEIGEPKRLDVQRLFGRLEIRPAAKSDGYAVVFPTGKRGGMPRISIGREAAESLRLTEGRTSAVVRGGAIVTED